MRKNILLSLSVLVLFACGTGGEAGTATTDGPGDTGGNTGGIELTSTKILTELFTSTTCGPCTAQNNNLDEYFAKYLNPETRKTTLKLVDEMMVEDDWLE